jgi:DNA polymerase-1
LLYGFFRSLVAMHKTYPDYFRVIAWDRGYARRLEESKRAMEAGVIPSEYKATRREAKTPEEEEVREAIHEQMDEVKEGLDLVKCLQVGVEGCEADDIIFTYAKQNQANGGTSVIVSSDKDFMQAIDHNIFIYDAMKQETWTLERFRVEFEFEPALWVDVGALEGEMGPTKDNIHGVDGWGPVTAVKYVRQYGTVEQIIEAVRAKPKKSKKEQVLLDSVPRVMLAKSLKRMDMLPFLPKPRVLHPCDQKEVERYFLSFGFASLLKEAWRLV